jgi:hypothetical protein
MSKLNINIDTSVPNNLKNLIENLLTNLNEKGVVIRTSEQPRISYGEGSEMMCSGYFIETPRAELGIAMGKPWQEWAPILLHECCHAAQWSENSELWKNMMYKGRDIVDYFDEYINGKVFDVNEYGENFIEKITKSIKDVEFDCEKRVVELIKENKIDIDLDVYIKKANAYVWYYDYAFENKIWYPNNNAPYENEEIWSNAPNYWVNNQPEDLFNAYEQAYKQKPKLKM